MSRNPPRVGPQMYAVVSRLGSPNLGRLVWVVQELSPKDLSEVLLALYPKGPYWAVRPVTALEDLDGEVSDRSGAMADAALTPLIGLTAEVDGLKFEIRL